MTMEDAHKREDLIDQAQHKYYDAIAAAQQSQNDTINTAWSQYELARGNAQTNYVHEVKSLDRELENELAAVEVETAEVVDPPPDQRPEDAGSDAEPAGAPGVLLDGLDQPAADPVNQTEIDIISYSRSMVIKLYSINESYYRSQGERRIVTDGLLCLEEMMAARLADIKAMTDLEKAESEKGGNTDEISQDS